jgi:hypothetical protein
MPNKTFISSPAGLFLFPQIGLAYPNDPDGFQSYKWQTS